MYKHTHNLRVSVCMYVCKIYYWSTLAYIQLILKEFYANNKIYFRVARGFIPCKRLVYGVKISDLQQCSSAFLSHDPGEANAFLRPQGLHSVNLHFFEKSNRIIKYSIVLVCRFLIHEHGLNSGLKNTINISRNGDNLSLPNVSCSAR
jgi:hypothetical protein